MTRSNDEIIYNVAVKNGFNDLSARLVCAQARFESADYTSRVFKLNNNTSGMKFISTARQPLATRGTLAPKNERSANCQANGTNCINRDYYAKFKTVEDSAKDKIERLYKITINGVTPTMLKNVKSPLEFAELLKRRGYYGFHKYGTTGATAEINQYSRGLSAKLKKVVIITGTGIVTSLIPFLTLAFFLPIS